MNDNRNKNNNHTFDIIEVNPVTQGAHKREVLWQITVPFVIVLLIFLGFVVFTAVSGIQGNGQLSRWADTSLIWLILPTLLIAFIFMALLAALVYGLFRLLRVLPGYTRKAQDIVYRIQDRVEAASNLAARPVIKVEGFRAALRAFLGR